MLSSSPLWRRKIFPQLFPKGVKTMDLPSGQGVSQGDSSANRLLNNAFIFSMKQLINSLKELNPFTNEMFLHSFLKRLYIFWCSYELKEINFSANSEVSFSFPSAFAFATVSSSPGTFSPCYLSSFSDLPACRDPLTPEGRLARFAAVAFLATTYFTSGFLLPDRCRSLVESRNLLSLFPWPEILIFKNVCRALLCLFHLLGNLSLLASLGPQQPFWWS